MIFFSIVIPSFNSSHLLFNLIDSLLKQSFCDFEILICDGASSDSFDNVVDKVKDPRVLFFSEPDLGVYDAMNKGIRLARGKWLYFLGVDDIFFNNYVLENFYSICRNISYPVVYGNVLIKGDTGWAKDNEIYAGKFSKNRMLVKSICHQAIIYRRDFLISNNLFFDLRFPVSADWHLNLRCRRLTRFKYVDLIIAIFSAGGISTTKRDSIVEIIRHEFADMKPSWFEIQVKETLKIVFHLFK